MMSKIQLMQGDCMELMKEIPDDSVDLILCDPPYGTMNTDGGRRIGIHGWDKKRLIDANKLNAVLQNIAEHLAENGDALLAACLLHCQEIVEQQRTIDAVEVVNGYSAGDVCFYGYFGSNNKSLALVEIVKISNDERGVAELKFLKVFVDDTGNGLFDYLLRSGKTMNGSFEFLKNITPNYGERKEDVNA